MVRAKSVVAAMVVAVVLPTLLETARTTADEKNSQIQRGTKVKIRKSERAINLSEWDFETVLILRRSTNEFSHSVYTSCTLHIGLSLCCRAAFDASQLKNC
jgi:hypothetical protein